MRLAIQVALFMWAQTLHSTCTAALSRAMWREEKIQLRPQREPLVVLYLCKMVAHSICTREKLFKIEQGLTRFQQLLVLLMQLLPLMAVPYLLQDPHLLLTCMVETYMTIPLYEQDHLIWQQVQWQ